MAPRTPWLVLILLTPGLVGCIGTDDATLDPASTQATIDDPANLTAFTKVHSPSEVTEILEGYAKLPGVDVETIGESLEERPVHLVTVGEGPFELWVVGRQHGDEPTGGEAILLAIEALADPDARLPANAPAIVHAMREHREVLLERLTFLFVPIANPDGAAAYQRTTAMMQDPNRDHYLFTQPAIQALREAFWAHMPDGCIDLHNEGLGETDFDAFGPVGPMLEEEPEALMLEDADLAVREVDAAGGNAGSMNENYRAPEPADEHPNPTAVHPGTHDMFCTTRGAPGWTPEGAIPAGENGVDSPPFEWSTRTHYVTIAASAMHWAGAYDATHPTVEKASGSTGLGTEHTVELDATVDARFQAVWRQTDAGGDHNPLPATFTVTTPDGTEILGREPGPERWTSTVAIEDAEPGTYTLTLDAPPAGTYEMRTYTEPAGTPILTVERTDGNLAVEASDDASGPVEVHLTDVADATDVDAAAIGATSAHTLSGTVDERTIVTYQLTLEPGALRVLETPAAWEEAGPYRFTATSGGVFHAGVEDAFNPMPDGR